MAILTPAPMQRRSSRNPVHNWHIIHRPWQIQPFLLAPVLPGETLKNGLFQARVVSDPVKNRLMGWWIEYYFFYVKHRDLEAREDFTAMMLDLEYDLSSHVQSAQVVKTNAAKGGIDWAALCRDCCVQHYFRDEDESVTSVDIPAIDGVPVSSWHGPENTFLDSAIPDSEFVGPSDVDVDADLDTNITASEIDKAMRTWQFQRMHGLTQMSYEDFLGTYGVSLPQAEIHRPELLRFVREWTYPSNTIADDGTASSALSWSISDRLDKDRRFLEPGFIIGLTVARPKVNLSGLKGSMASMMKGALPWLPAILSDDPYTSLMKIPAADGPMAGVVGEDYWVDVKDLFMYGEPFTNFDMATVTGMGQVAIPRAGLAKTYPLGTDADSLFVSGTLNKVEQNGRGQFNIATTIRDTTPQGIAPMM